jgi:hypothetical protein
LCDKYKIAAIPVELLTPITGQEDVNIVVGGVTLPLVDNCGRLIPAQRLALAKGNCREVEGRVMFVQVTTNATELVATGRRGFRCRKTTAVAPAAPA